MKNQYNYSKSYLARHYALSANGKGRSERDTDAVLLMLALIIILIGAKTLHLF